MPSTSDSSSAQAPPTDISLATRIGNLPRELYDEIFDFVTLTVKSNSIIKIKPPKQLQINKATRQKVALWYYSSNVFRPKNLPSTSELCRWLKTLSTEHTLLIGTISSAKLFGVMPASGHYSLDFVQESLGYLERCIAKGGVQLRWNCVKGGLPRAAFEQNRRLLKSRFPTTDQVNRQSDADLMHYLPRNGTDERWEEPRNAGEENPM